MSRYFLRSSGNSPLNFSDMYSSSKKKKSVRKSPFPKKETKKVGDFLHSILLYPYQYQFILSFISQHDVLKYWVDSWHSYWFCTTYPGHSIALSNNDHLLWMGFCNLMNNFKLSQEMEDLIKSLSNENLSKLFHIICQDKWYLNNYTPPNHVITCFVSLYSSIFLKFEYYYYFNISLKNERKFDCTYRYCYQYI